MAAHNQALARAASTVLKPLGLQQRGRSRTWIDDHGWWVCVVDFESSAWSKGSGLSVYADFLWHDRDYLAHSHGGRLEDVPFVEVDRVDDFGAVADGLALRAATEVHQYRERFPDLDAWTDELVQCAGTGNFWNWFDAGVASGLLGRGSEACAWLRRVAKADDERDWAIAARHRAADLDRLAADRAAFRAEVGRAVTRFRAAINLPEQPVSFD